MSTIQSCLWLVGKGLQVAPRLLVDDAVEVVGSGRAEDAEDVVELVKVVLAREYWPEQSNVNSIYFLTSLDLLCPLNNKKKTKNKKKPTEIPAYSIYLKSINMSFRISIIIARNKRA